MDSFIPELRFTKTCREREWDWDWSRIEYEGLYGFDLSDPHDRSEGMSSCLRLPLVTAGGSEILVHVPVRKARVHCSSCPCAGPFSIQLAALLSPRRVGRPGTSAVILTGLSSVLQAE